MAKNIFVTGHKIKRIYRNPLKGGPLGADKLSILKELIMRLLSTALLGVALLASPLSFADGKCNCSKACHEACANGKAEKCNCKDKTCECKTGNCKHGKCHKPAETK